MCAYNSLDYIAICTSLHLGGDMAVVQSHISQFSHISHMPPQKKTILTEEILCQTRRRVRSLLDVNEELAYRSATPKMPLICSMLSERKVGFAEGVFY